MTSNEIAIPPERPAAQLELDRYARLGVWLAALESGKQDANSAGAAAALRFYYADSLELPATAVAEITVIKGKLFIGAQLLRALAERGGYRVARLESNDETCTAVLVVRETGEELGRTTFTLEHAKRAGLIRDGSAWKTHPARMLWARASTLVIRDFAPAVSLGMYGEDEISEVTPAMDRNGYIEDPSIPFGDTYQPPTTVEAEIGDQLEQLSDERGDPGHTNDDGD
jgi:hypothetical protein